MMKHVLPDTISDRKRRMGIYRAALVCAVLLCLACSIGTVSAGTAPEIAVVTPDSAVKVGEVLTVPVVFYNMTDIASFAIEIPKDVAGVTIAFNSSRPLTGGMYTLNEESDKLLLSWFSAYGVSGDKVTLFSIDLTPTADAPQSFEIHVVPTTIGMASFEEITASVVATPGTVILAKPPVVGEPTVNNITYSSATVTFTVSANPAATEVKAVLSDGTEFPATESAGTYTAELTGLTPETEYTVSGWAKNDVDETTGESVTFKTLYKPEVSEIILSGEPASLIRIGTTGELTEEVLDQKQAPMTAAVNWTSSNTSVISIDADGNYEALAKGTATLKAAIDSVTNETSEITVIGTPAVLITAPTDTSADMQSEITFTAELTDFDSGATVSWEFGDGNSSTGESVLYSYKKAGPYTVKVTATGTDLLGDSATADDTITMNIVRPNAVATALVITGTPEEQPLVFGTEGTLGTIVYDQFGDPMTPTVTWITSNDKIVTITSAGDYKGVGEGTVTITATAGTATNTTTISVLAEVMVPTTISITEPEATVAFDAADQAKALVLDQHGKEMSGETVTWSGDNDSVLSIEADGTYTAHRVAGTVNLTATSVTDKNVSASRMVTNVRPASIATNLTITNVPTEPIAFNATGNLSTVILDQFGEEMTAPVTWKSDKPSLLTINETGFYKGIDTGVVNVTAAAGNASNTTMITILPEILVPTSVKITEPVFGTQYEIGKTGSLSAIVYDQHLSELSSETVNWVSSNSSLVSVTGTQFTAVNAGNVVLTATCVNTTLNVTVSSNVTITVLPAALKPSLPLDSGDINVENGTTTVSNTSKAGIEVNEDDKQLNITDSTNNVVLTVRFTDMEYDSANQTVSGNLSMVTAVYPEIDAVPDANNTNLTGSNVRVSMNLQEIVTDLPQFLAAIDQQVQSQIENAAPAGMTYDVGLMLQATAPAGFNEKLSPGSSVTLIFELPRDWVDHYGADKILVKHIGNTVDDVSRTLVLDQQRGVYILTIRSPYGFSSYAVIGVSGEAPVPPAPSYSGDNGGADDGAELLASVGASATTKPTTAPTTKPVTEPTIPATVVPTSGDGTVPPVPTGSGATPTTVPPTTTQGPVPLFGILAGLGAAIALGRKYR